jgi:transposase-like protein
MHNKTISLVTPSKTLKGDFGELPIEIPRDRHGCFEPQIIAKHQTRWTGSIRRSLMNNN